MALSKVLIKDTDRGNNIHAQFNPKEYSISKLSTWVEYNNQGGDVPFVHFTSGKRRELKMELFFDTSREQKNVSTYVKELESLMMIISQAIKRPPLLFVSWGKESLYFKCVLEQMDQRYTMFSESGKPLRAVVNVTFKEISLDEGKSLLGGVDAPSSAKKEDEIKEFKKGDNLHNIVAQKYGSASATHAIATYNGIDDISKISPKTKIRLPPLSKLSHI